MTQTFVRDHAGSADPSGAPTGEGAGVPRRRLGVPLALQIGAMIGIGALLYSSAADWFATLNHDSEISGYIDSVEQLPDHEREAELQLARDYNAHMPQGVLRDPYSAPAEQNERDAAYRAYEEVLRVSDNGVIGDLAYPRLGIGLPLYHGTSDEVLAKGAGHLYGSSLPVGGPSTHSVLTSHSGLLKASLFTPLPGARIGDTFQVTVLGETHYYEVDRIDTVEPEQTEGLRIVHGEDYVTLITCTPIGINSHRLLVRGVRVDAPTSDDGRALAGDGRTAGFPWWAVGFAGGSAAVAWVLFAPPSGRRRQRRQADGTSAKASGTTGEAGE